MENMEFKGTKGKWFIVRGEVSELGECISIAEKPESKVKSKLICLITRANCLDEVDIANAQLISKAPEVLEMLEKVLNNSDVPSEIYDQAKQLIKEATTI